MKIYEAPELFVDEYVADTMIASSGSPKNGHAGSGGNQNCWACADNDGDVVFDGKDWNACLEFMCD